MYRKVLSQQLNYARTRFLHPNCHELPRKAPRAILQECAAGLGQKGGVYRLVSAREKKSRRRRHRVREVRYHQRTADAMTIADTARRKVPLNIPCGAVAADTGT